MTSLTINFLPYHDVSISVVVFIFESLFIFFVLFCCAQASTKHSQGLHQQNFLEKIW